MKKLIFIFFIVFHSYSQHKINYDYVNETNDSYGTSKTIFKCYLFTDNSYSKFVKDRVINGQIEKELSYPENDLEEKFREEDNKNIEGDSIGYVVTKFLKTDSLYVRNIVGTLLKENLKREFVIVDEFKVINKYNCQKAFTYIYGREFEVWFTSEIPISDGPWKLSGLPGLILEAHSKDRFHNFYFTAIKKISDCSYLYSPVPYKRIMDREKNVKSRIEMVENTFKYRKSKYPFASIKIVLNDLDLPLIVFE